MKQKIGIWGFAVVGKSVLNYLLAQDYNKNYDLEVLDKRSLTQDEDLFLKSYNISYKSQDDIINFFENNDKIIVSPGIDTKNYNEYRHKIICELDLFSANWDKPVIAITGTIGKTSIAHLISQLIKNTGLSVATIGNIGTGMLDVVANKEAYDIAVLELSSFQLEFASNFSPNLAVWTNLYPNHLDRHETLDNYFNAKFNIIANQKQQDQALLPWNLKDKFLQKSELNNKALHFFCDKILSTQELNNLREQDTVYYLDNNKIIKYHKNTCTNILDINNVSYSFSVNWLILACILELLKISTNSINLLLDNPKVNIPQHRLEYVDTINNIKFYNDSKATISQATVAAIEQLAKEKRNICLFLGGIIRWSSGANKLNDIVNFIASIKNKVNTIICFGAESDLLYQACLLNNLKAYKCQNLDTAFNTCISIIKPGDLVLLSPAGASYDLFKDYQERGNYFKLLINKFKNEPRYPA